MVLKLSKFKLSNIKKNPLPLLYVGGALLLLVAGWLWCAKVSMDPERVFWGTIEQGLATHGVTVRAEQSVNGSSKDEVIRYSMGSDNLSHSITTAVQGNTTVKSEVVGTSTTDYTRYLSVETDQKKADGSQIDFSRILGVWVEGFAGMGQQFTQALFGGSLPVGGVIVPIGNLQSGDRAELVKQAKNDMVYKIEFDKTKKERVNGRTQYTYEVTMQSASYVALMKKFAQSVGIHGLDQVNPDDYKTQKPFKVQITVDARARQVVRVTSVDSGATQTYVNHGVPVKPDVPKDVISREEFQKILSEIQ